MGNRIELKLVINKDYYLKWISKLNYMSQKIFGNNLVAIRKNKVTLTLSNPAGVCIFELSKLLRYKFHYHYMKNKHGGTNKDYWSQALIVQCITLKLKMPSFEEVM